MCNHWPLNVNSKKYRPVLKRRGLNEQCRNLPQYRERSFTDTVSQKDEKPPPAGLDDTAIPHIEKPAWKKVQYHNTVNPHVPPPSKIIMSEIFNLYELSNYMKKNDQNRISVLPECLLKAERNLFYRSSRRKEFYNLARFWKWSTDSYPLTLKLIRGGRDVLRWCGFARFCCGLREFLLKVAVLGFYKTKWFAVFRNFRVILMRFAVFLLFCAVFIRNSVRFCDIPTPLTPPLIQKAFVRSFYLKYLFAILIQRLLFFERSQTNYTL